MKITVVVCLLAVAAFCVPAVRAQDTPKVDIFAGYSYVRDNPATTGVDGFDLQGGSASIDYNLNNWLSGVADFGGYHNGNILNTGVDGTLSTYLFGPRVSIRHWDRVTPFGEVLFGVAHVSANALGAGASDNAFAMSVGGGFDVKVARHFSIRPVKVDYLLTRFDETGTGAQSQNNLRVSTGVVFHF